MKKTPFHHPYTIDRPTLELASSEGNKSCLSSYDEFGDRLHFLEIDPAEFTHAYTLLGSNPQRFTTDLSLYLATIRTFFERADAAGGIQIPETADPDAKRRLGEDLGVALSAKFMVSVFGLAWDSIAQIPMNNSLSKKRPDFIGFTPEDVSFIFESKGTTVVSSIEKQISKAIEQVKQYPVNARSKIAIISFLAADKRLFPSTTFVVDPPFPDILTPNPDSARLLHGEKVLQFLGLPESAADYLDAVAAKLRMKDNGSSKYFEEKAEEFQRTFDREIADLHLNVSESTTGRTLERGPRRLNAEITFEVSNNTLSELQNLTPIHEGKEAFTELLDDEVVSHFPDGTTLRIKFD